MRKTLWLVAAIVGGLELAPRAQSVPVFKASVDLVPISAIVRDDRGRLVTSLTAADFQVFDSGALRRIVDFQTDNSSPITMAVLVDVSGSMRMGRRMALAGEVLNGLRAALREGHDEVALFTFDAALHEQHPFTRSPQALSGALDAASPFGSTSLYDAVAETARRIVTRPAQRRAIVVITDGVDTSSSMTPADVSGLASSIDVPVYVVATVPRIDQQAYHERTAGRPAQPSGDLRELAVWTGGDLLWVRDTLEAPAQASMILAELRHQYLIAIESAADGQWRALDVRTRNRRLSVRTRSGYFGRDALSQ